MVGLVHDSQGKGGNRTDRKCCNHYRSMKLDMPIFDIEKGEGRQHTIFRTSEGGRAISICVVIMIMIWSDKSIAAADVYIIIHLMCH